MNAACLGLDPWYFGGDYKRRPYWDANGAYVKQWLPELANLPVDDWKPPSPPPGGTAAVDCLYSPWAAPLAVLAHARVQLGVTYPPRCVDERAARAAVVAALQARRASWARGCIDSDAADPAADPAAGRAAAGPGRGPKAQGFDMVPLGRGGPAVSVFTPKALRMPRRKASWFAEKGGVS